MRGANHIQPSATASPRGKARLEPWPAPRPLVRCDEFVTANRETLE